MKTTTKQERQESLNLLNALISNEKSWLKEEARIPSIRARAKQARKRIKELEARKRLSGTREFTVHYRPVKGGRDMCALSATSLADANKRFKKSDAKYCNVIHISEGVDPKCRVFLNGGAK